MKNLLRFGTPNAKLKALEISEYNLTRKRVATFSLPSGYTCPGAKECLSYANRKTGKIKDGQHTKFRCFQASAEAVYPSLRNMVWNNFDALRKVSKDADDGQDVNAMANLILESLEISHYLEDLSHINFELIQGHKSSYPTSLCLNRSLYLLECI